MGERGIMAIDVKGAFPVTPDDKSMRKSTPQPARRRKRPNAYTAGNGQSPSSYPEGAASSDSGSPETAESGKGVRIDIVI